MHVLAMLSILLLSNFSIIGPLPTGGVIVYANIGEGQGASLGTRCVACRFTSTRFAVPHYLRTGRVRLYAAYGNKEQLFGWVERDANPKARPAQPTGWWTCCGWSTPPAS